MQLIITIENENRCHLPISYHHLQQSAIYSLLRDTTIAGELHDYGSAYGKRTYKLFTFGPLTGRYVISGKEIIFQDEIQWEIRCDDRQLAIILYEKILKDGLRLGENAFEKVKVQVRDTRVEQDCITVKMLSPICVYETDNQTKRTHFFSPEEDKFSKAVQENFYRKYLAANKLEPESNINIVPLLISGKDKYLTKYKGFFINGWKGIYQLSGERKYLDFLYQTGLGAKNSQGFGMFEIIDCN